MVERGVIKSLNRSCVGRHFNGTENEIWAGFGPVDSYRSAILKKIGADYEKLLRVFFSCFQGQKKFEIFLKTL